MSTPPDWATRMEIIKGIAHGLVYLHVYMSIIHGNLTTRNVLLDEQSHPKIAEFGWSRLMTTAANSEVLPVASELCYRAPELSRSKEANTKTDVYSLGIIILELLTGKLPESKDLQQWVAREEWSSLMFDHDLMRDEQAAPTWAELQDTLMLALQCVDPSPLVRPQAQEVLSKLEEICPRPENATGPCTEPSPSSSLSPMQHEAWVELEQTGQPGRESEDAEEVLEQALSRSVDGARTSGRPLASVQIDGQEIIQQTEHIQNHMKRDGRTRHPSTWKRRPLSGDTGSFFPPSCENLSQVAYRVPRLYSSTPSTSELCDNEHIQSGLQDGVHTENVLEQSSSEWRQQPAGIFQVSDLTNAPQRPRPR